MGSYPANKSYPSFFLMFIYPHHLVFIFTLVYGTVTAISSNNWFTCWVGLEINLISIIPLILIKLTPKLSEAVIKYFLVQAFASTLLILISNLGFQSSEASSLEITEILILVSLALKGGVAPFHSWFPQVSENLGWNQCLILFTWQKLAPLLLITNLSLYKTAIMAGASAGIGALRGLNQIKFKLLLTYSSISHRGWIITLSIIKLQAWVNYFLVYCTLSLCIIFSIKKSGIKKITDMTEWHTESYNKKILIFNIFSLAGLPPFLGFIVKMSAIIFIIKMQMPLLLLTLILSSLLSLYFYYRITYSSSIRSGKSKKLNFFSLKKEFYSLLTICTLMNVAAPIFNLIV